MVITEFIQNNPRIGIIGISLLVTLGITIVNYFMTDKERMKELREKQKRLKEEMKKYKDNPQKMMEINKQMMEDLPEQMKHSFKPMLITIIPLLILFSWLRSNFAVTAISSTWIWYYIGFSMLFSIILRKMFGLQ
ncbi:MAG: EMC3/TMCO1 family protein [Candidatus Pacearchaeota archaeon]